MPLDLKDIRRAAPQPDRPFDLQSALRRARWLTWRRRLFSAIGGLALILGIVYGASLLGGSEPGPVAPFGDTNSPEVPAYGLSSFEIGYPYDDPRSDVGPSDSTAEVSFVAQWSDGRYPGRVQCQVLLRGDSGQVVGTEAVEVDSGTDGARMPAITVGVSGKPVAAEGTCGGRSYPPGEGYVVSGPANVSRPINSDTDKPYENRTELTFDVEWQSDSVHPGLRTCYISIARTDGTTDEVKFNLNAGPGPISFNVAGEPSSVKEANLRCEPFSEN